MANSALRLGCLAGAVILLANAGLLAPGGHSMAAEPRPVASETRQFEVLVDGKPCGASTLVITEYDDGRILASTTADIKVTVLLFSYIYQFNGAEEWRDDKFHKLDSRAVDGAKRLTLKAEVENERTLLQTADGKTRAAPLHALTTNYWRSPPEAMLGKAVPVLDADTGKTLQLKFEYVGPKLLTLLGKPVDCHYYKATGEKEVELWFDGAGRMVRQIGKEDGYRTEARLTDYRVERGLKR